MLKKNQAEYKKKCLKKILEQTQKVIKNLSNLEIENVNLYVKKRQKTLKILEYINYKTKNLNLETEQEKKENLNYIYEILKFEKILYRTIEEKRKIILDEFFESNKNENYFNRFKSEWINKAGFTLDKTC